MKMIDNISVKAFHSLPYEALRKREPLNLYGMTFNPKYKNNEVIEYVSKVNNLKAILDSSFLTLIGSLHTYYYGNNFGDFSYENLKSSIYQLNKTLGGDLLDGNVNKIEFGYNLKTNINFEVFKRYRDKAFSPMVYNGRVYGSQCFCSDFVIKSYDKTYQTKRVYRLDLEDQILRIEKKVKRLKHINSKKKAVGLYKVSDLLNKDKLELLKDDLVHCLNEIELKQSFHFDNLSISDKKILGYMQNPDVREAIKNDHPETYRKDLRKFRAMNVFNDNKMQIINQIEMKHSELMNK